MASVGVLAPMALGLAGSSRLERRGCAFATEPDALHDGVPRDSRRLPVVSRRLGEALLILPSTAWANITARDPMAWRGRSNETVELE